MKMHADLYEFRYYTHDHAGCAICSTNIQGCDTIKANLQEMMDEGLIHIIRPRTEYEEEVNMVYGFPDEFQFFYVNYMDVYLVHLHATFCHMNGYEVYHYGSRQICCRDSRGCSVVRKVFSCC